MSLACGRAMLIGAVLSGLPSIAEAASPKPRPITGFLDIGEHTSQEVADYCQPLIDYWSKGLKVTKENQQAIATCYFFFSGFVERICSANGYQNQMPLIPFMQMWVRAVRDPTFYAGDRSMRDTLVAATMGSNICPAKPKPDDKPGAIAPG